MLDREIAVASNKILNSNIFNAKDRQRLAAMKVLKWKLLQKRIGKTRNQGFRNERELLDYSWELFRDKIDSKVALLAKPSDP